MPSRVVLTQMKLSIQSVALRTIDIIIIQDHFVLTNVYALINLNVKAGISLQVWCRSPIRL